MTIDTNGGIDGGGSESYLLYDRCIRVVAHDPSLLGAATFVLKSIGAANQEERSRLPDLSLELESSTSTLDVPSSAHFHVELTHDIKVWKEAERTYLHHPDGVLVLDGSSTARGFFRRGGNSVGPHVLLILTVGLVLLLRRFELYAIHGACAVHPERGGHLIVGPSASGKSTLTYSLVRSGWRFLSDDSLILKSANSHVEAMPFRRHFYVDDATAARFEELSAAKKERSEFNEDKWRVAVDRLYEGQAASSCVPRVMLFASTSDRRKTELHSIGKKQALLRLLPQAGIILDPDRSAAGKHLDMLRQLAEQTETLQLVAGRDVLLDASLIDSVLTAR